MSGLHISALTLKTLISCSVCVCVCVTLFTHFLMHVSLETHKEAKEDTKKVNNESHVIYLVSTELF